MARAENHMELPKQLIIIMMIVVLLLLQFWSSHGCLEEERVALMQLRHSLSYPKGTPLTPWDIDVDCCKWSRVVCDDTTGRITEILLNYVRVQSLGDWSFNASLFLPFQQLKILYLSGNKIVCCARNEGFEGLQKLNNLEDLDLKYNRLSNNVLSMFNGFQSLKILSLSHNKLNGSIHVKDLANIPKLEELRLWGNNIEKFVSSKDIQSSSNISTLLLSSGGSHGSSFELLSLKAFQNLKSLSFELSNEMQFPQGIKGLQRLSNLEALYLDYNGLKNNALSILHGFQSLKNLSLINTTLSGSIYVKGFSNFKNLKLLKLSYSIVDNSFLHSITNITSLETLQLRSCKLGSSINELCKLKNLQWLDLQENGISGSLPPCLTNFTHLKYLDISYNNFVEKLSKSPLKTLTSIEYLSMSDNQFQIPMSLSPFFNHSKLKHLDVRGNEVYAESDGFDNYRTPKFQLEELWISSTYGRGGVSFPRFLHYQHELQYLNFSSIQLREAGFPSWLLDSNKNLETIYLANCSLSGVLHLPSHPHVKLKNLAISNNHFYGHIPTEIGNYFPMLEGLFFTRNDFIGKIPNSLFNCSLLAVLDMRHNQLFGKIPKWIGHMPSMEMLDLSNNNFSGSLSSIFIPPYALHIYLSHNRLEGPFSHVLPNSGVFTLDLSHNCLIGNIPNSIENLYRLRHVLLSHNNLDGEIPTYLWKMMNELKFVDLSYNMLGLLSLKSDTSNTSQENNTSSTSQENNYGGPWGFFVELIIKGNIYQYDTSRMYNIDFIGLDLSSNNLACSIPFEIGNKEGMKMVNLSHNNLVGYIPSSFSNMTEVESLDLSYNNLSGTLPPQLIQLKFLQVFSVAFNNLSGKTPKRVAQFATFEEISYRGNSLLCGEPLHKNCTPPASSMTKESWIDDVSDGFIDMEVFQISFWVTFTIILLGIASVLYINPYWRQAWFSLAEMTITSCYYFLVDHLPFLSKFGITLCF